MSTFTKFLNLFKWNPETDPDEEFDIEKALNENWEKIDTKLEDYIDEVDTRFENYTDEINAEIENFEQNSFATVEMTNRYIGDAYDSTRNYKVGDFCIHNNTLYKCITAITVPENFNVDKWKVTNLSDETELLQQAKVPVGGAKGQILAKKSDTNNDTEWVSGVSVVDNLNSTSETDALSAKQGKVLKEFLTPTILYQNSNGESSTVNLSDDVANYERIEITFRVNTVLKTAIWEKHGSKPYCVLDFVDFYNDQLIFCTKIVNLSGTTITPYRQKKYTIGDSSTWTPYGSADSEINIIAVRGYKY